MGDLQVSSATPVATLTVAQQKHIMDLMKRVANESKALKSQYPGLTTHQYDLLAFFKLALRSPEASDIQAAQIKIMQYKASVKMKSKNGELKDVEAKGYILFGQLLLKFATEARAEQTPAQ